MTTESGQLFTTHFTVRDYECDQAMGVNNSVYMNYLEHARHEYLKSIGADFAYWARQKVGMVVTRIECDFRHSLVSGDQFIVTTSMERASRLRFRFLQHIYRLPDNKPVLNAMITGTAVDENNRPRLPPEMAKVLDAVCPYSEAK